jgi:hypothetical protein
MENPRMNSRHIMVLWVSGPKSLGRPEVRKYDVHPGRDDNVDSPTGYFVVKNQFRTQGVAHQYEITLQKGDGLKEMTDRKYLLINTLG